MNGHAHSAKRTAGYDDNETRLDVLIIGAGISGVNAAYRVQTELPSSSYAILEGRHELGGTWSQFRYPGVRSDSDLHTLGYKFNPWKARNPIATGDSILTYLQDTVQKFDLEKRIRYHSKVASANWSSEQQRWQVDVDVGRGDEKKRVVYWAKWMILGAGFYSYDTPMHARIPGLVENFEGQTVHPQFWPEDLDYRGKKVVIIGSGATAITLMPALVEGGVGHVTQLQRSPSYILSLSQPGNGSTLPWWQRVLPQWAVLRWKRFQFTLVPILLYYFCIYFPSAAASVIRGAAKKQLPADFPIDPHFKPGYNPWEQRLCVCPDGDFFKCLHDERASIVTDTIKEVVSDGIVLNSGDKLDADIIITATGLNLRFLGGIDLAVDGKKVDVPSEYMWRFAMLSNLPNLGHIFGYWNASWTLGSDSACRLFTRVIKHMNENGYTSAIPTITDAEKENPQSLSPLNSTYVKASTSRMPKCGNSGPWAPREYYFKDKWKLEHCDLNDGMRFERVST
ncbi:FAD/NAD(P)-binding domain-containing protein [Didymella exigua CBS 183.55]|uniref:FAD/NAD(P)-binding domain-containing protein n=1 Tax=Didymella exigua CBS 183.55 TaxID=1150837 RepID=A0A6A5RQC3_9PLEO|nr:FAD/NAD(P)-binding domain-containing protein [Didymella exigua CBS 183.55]KAF1928506.1 FAD/NAD(P)-binding domain-containing protein [Didymella exigua CBS 183.55]